MSRGAGREPTENSPVRSRNAPQGVYSGRDKDAGARKAFSETLGCKLDEVCTNGVISATKFELALLAEHRTNATFFDNNFS